MIFDYFVTLFLNDGKGNFSLGQQIIAQQPNVNYSLDNWPTHESNHDSQGYCFGMHTVDFNDDNFIDFICDGGFMQPMDGFVYVNSGDGTYTIASEQLIKKYGYSDWYSWCVDNWGTKWDINVNQIECSLSGETEKIDIVDSEEFKGLKHINFWFESAYNAPISAYNTLLLKKPNLKLTATYYEKGYWFCGVYKNGVDDYKNEIPSSDDAYWDTDNGKLLIQWTGLRDEIINDEENEIEE